MLPPIIGIHGKAHAGKSTIAEHLVQKYGYREIAFADKLKETLAVAFDWPLESLYNPQFKETVDPVYGISPRTAMQKIGTEGFRNLIDLDFWVKATMRRIQAIRAENPDVRFVLSDIRLPNELQAVRNAGGMAWKVVRPTDDLAPENEKHISETALDDWHEWDAFIQNSGTLEYLKFMVDSLIKNQE